MINFRTLLSYGLLLMTSLAYGQGKKDPRTILFTKIQPTMTKVTNSSDSSKRPLSRLINRMPGQSKEELTDVFVTLAYELTEDELLKMGIKNPVIIGNVVAGSVDLNRIDELEQNEAVISISVSGKAKLHCDLAREDTGVDIIRTGKESLPHGYDGSGVVVSTFDQGIEPGHINFLSPDRTESRVRQIWHYDTKENNFGVSSTKETGYLTPKEIADFKTDDANLTHGTHTLGIMTGSFGMNGEDPENNYSGMAPASDILIGCGSLSYTNVIRAIKRFKEYADKEKKPLVVNLSFGDNIGPHDGTDAFPKALNELAATIPVFMSSGNEANTKIALNKTFSEEDKEIKTVISSRNTIKTYLGVSWEAACEVQVWSEDNTPVTIQTGLWDKAEEKWVFSLPLPKKGEASYIANGAYTQISNFVNDDFDYLYQDSAIGISYGVDSNNGKFTADIWYMLNKQTNHIDRNIVPALIITGEPGKRVDVYCDGDYNEFDYGRIQGWDAGSADGTISNIACGKNTISVGSYCTRKITESSVEGEVSDFSSWGILSDGRVLPDILAPGDCLASSMSTPFTESEYYSEQVNPAVYGVMYGEDNPFYWTIMSGTSQSSPVMAGIAALWLQANPDLTPDDIKKITVETARPTSVMTPQCGAGKVDALNGLKKALQLASVNEVESIGNSNLLITESAEELRVETVAGDEFNVEIFDLSGRMIKRIMSYDGGPIVIRKHLDLSKGVYLIKINSRNESCAKKVIL